MYPAVCLPGPVGSSCMPGGSVATTGRPRSCVAWPVQPGPDSSVTQRESGRGRPDLAGASASRLDSQPQAAGSLRRTDGLDFADGATKKPSEPLLRGVGALPARSRRRGVEVVAPTDGSSIRAARRGVRALDADAHPGDGEKGEPAWQTMKESGKTGNADLGCCRQSRRANGMIPFGHCQSRLPRRKWRRSSGPREQGPDAARSPAGSGEKSPALFSKNHTDE